MLKKVVIFKIFYYRARIEKGGRESTEGDRRIEGNEEINAIYLNIHMRSSGSSSCK